MKKIVTIGGGSGTFNLVSGLKKLDNIYLNVIVSMSDDGGSTGFLRDEYGILPPGDLRRALVALADEEKSKFLRKLFSYRFNEGFLKGHNLGNLIMKAAEDIEKDYIKSIRELEDLFGIEKGKVYPSTLEKTRLIAKLENGQYVIGETNIDIPKHDPNLKISEFAVIKEKYAKILKNMLDNGFLDIVRQEFISIYNKSLKDKPVYYPEIKDIILNADYIIFGPGDLYTSILPNILLGNLIDIIKQSKAKKIFISNLFTKPGETTDFKLSDFLNVFNKYFKQDIFDYIISQDTDKLDIPEDILKRYSSEGKSIVEDDIKNSKIIKENLISMTDVVRHDSEKLAKVLKGLIK